MIETEAPATNYVLARLVLGSDEQITPSKSEYDEIAAARACLSAITSVEEKFFAISENYRSIQEFIFRVTLEETIYGFCDVSKMHQISSDLGRHILSFLSSTRLYTDSICGHARSVSDGAIEDTQIKAIFSTEYDKEYSYRVMEALRNYSQHHEFPVNAWSLGGSWDKDRSVSIHTAKFFFDTKHISGDFKSKIRIEIESNGGKVDLKDCLRNYFGSICDIHTEVRTLFLPYKERSEAIIECTRDRWRSTFDSSLLGVTACGLTGELLDENHKQISISTQIEEYREHLSRRTAFLGNMSKRRVQV